MSELTRELFDTLAQVLLRCLLIGIALILLTFGVGKIHAAEIWI